MAVFTQTLCSDFLQFQEALKKMRLLDDTIIYALNVQLPTESFSGNKDCNIACQQFHNQLESNYTNREQAVQKCLEFTKKRVSELRDIKNKNENDPSVLKQLRKEQTKVRLLESELGVEEVIKTRTKKVFYERCRPYYLPENFDL